MFKHSNIKSHLHHDLSFQISSPRIPMSNHIYIITVFLSGAIVWVCSVKKAFLKTFENSQENTCVGVSFLIKCRSFQLHFKRESGTGIFLYIFRNLLRTFILWNISKRLLLFFFIFVISISINASVELILNMIILLKK